ncbi:hypothetical protein SAMN02745127_02875 [Oceanospirillum multiglobuliferum]|uniref:hypothetical protein n=1 Tax=Oceanospirillum multiglobuliferum TaxID=64969 RepID=UPI0009D449F2|nr:hypothetical protein [Oceanospirillum multiglobuliferum]SKA24950.1 hypothetical protein SAMN02745127_02875 [Oceanospirillum multiglobuliferum]
MKVSVWGRVIGLLFLVGCGEEHSASNRSRSTDGYGSYLDKIGLPVDGQSVWPE